MTIIITGAAGFIGSNYVYYHLNAHSEDKIVVIDKLTHGLQEELYRNLP